MYRTIPTLAAAGVALVLLAGCASPAATPAAHTSSSRPAAPTPTATLPGDPADYGLNADGTATADPPTPADFKITLAVREKQCFGSAGCNLVVRPGFTWLGASPLTAGVDITYVIRGGDSGLVTSTASVDSEGTVTFNDESISTRSSATKVTATITAVSLTS